jgi:hypothetical protein
MAASDPTGEILSDRSESKDLIIAIGAKLGPYEVVATFPCSDSLMAGISKQLNPDRVRVHPEFIVS